MSISLKTRTIRKRMMQLNFLISVFIGLLVIAYSYQFFSIERKLITLEEFHDLFDNVLEVRRYEKNYLLDVGSKNIDKILEYIEKIDDHLKWLNDDIVRVTGAGNFRQFRTNLDSYQSIFAASLTTGGKTSVNPEVVRRLGKAMEFFTSRLLDEKQRRIRDSFKVTIFSFILITGLFFLFIIIGLYQQAKSVLDRIAFVQQATGRVTEGNFTPIDTRNLEKDEISDLIYAFNKMASELDNRQEQLIQSKKLASIGTFSSGIAHELNNPLNNISLSADTLLEEYSDLSEQETKEIVHDIIDQTDRASNVVKNLLDFSRDRSPKTELLNIKDVLNSTRKLIANELRLKAIWMEDYVPENLPCVLGDLQKLQQVFLNLFMNSLHVMPEGGLIYIDGEVDPSGYVKVNVNDTGTGIAPENIEQIFDPFYTTKEVGKGTGLGLSIVYGIVKKHGGYIEAKSKMNVGTTFSIFLPVAPGEQAQV